MANGLQSKRNDLSSLFGSSSFVLEIYNSQGGELFDKVVKGKLKEYAAKKYFQQLIDAIDFCHSKGVYHRDLKPENLLLDENGYLKVTDFGLSALFESRRQDGLLHTTCVTPAYVAPEVINRRGYDGAKADIWSCGVILFVLLAGYLPFKDPNLMELYKKISKGDFKCPNWFPPTTKAIRVSPPEDSASNKENSSNGINGSTLPSNEKKIKKQKKKKMKHNHTDDIVVEESREGESQSKKKAKKAHIISETNLNATPNEVAVSDRVDGAEKKLKAKKKGKKSHIICETNLNATPNEVAVSDRVDGAEKKLKARKKAKKAHIIGETNLNATPDEEAVVTDRVDGAEKKLKAKKKKA